MIPRSQIRTPDIQEKRATLREKRLELNKLAHYHIGHDLTPQQRQERLQDLRIEVLRLDNELASLYRTETHRIVRRMSMGHPNPFGSTY